MHVLLCKAYSIIPFDPHSSAALLQAYRLPPAAHSLSFQKPFHLTIISTQSPVPSGCVPRKLSYTTGVELPSHSQVPPRLKRPIQTLGSCGVDIDKIEFCLNLTFINMDPKGNSLYQVKIIIVVHGVHVVNLNNEISTMSRPC